MSGGTIFLLVLFGIGILTAVSFFYGFKMGVRAERTDWDLRRMMKTKEKVIKAKKPTNLEKATDLETAINEQLGIWQNQSDAVDSEFCEKYMGMLQQLRLHVNRAKRESAKKWQKMKPIWEQLDFERVTMNTCLTYDLTSKKVVEHLNSLLEAANKSNGVVTWAQ